MRVYKRNETILRGVHTTRSVESEREKEEGGRARTGATEREPVRAPERGEVGAESGSSLDQLGAARRCRLARAPAARETPLWINSRLFRQRRNSIVSPLYLNAPPLRRVRSLDSSFSLFLSLLLSFCPSPFSETSASSLYSPRALSLSRSLSPPLGRRFFSSASHFFLRARHFVAPSSARTDRHFFAPVSRCSSCSSRSPVRARRPLFPRVKGHCERVRVYNIQKYPRANIYQYTAEHAITTLHREYIYSRSSL